MNRCAAVRLATAAVLNDAVRAVLAVRTGKSELEPGLVAADFLVSAVKGIALASLGRLTTFDELRPASRALLPIFLSPLTLLVSSDRMLRRIHRAFPGALSRS